MTGWRFILQLARARTIAGLIAAVTSSGLAFLFLREVEIAVADSTRAAALVWALVALAGGRALSAATAGLIAELVTIDVIHHLRLSLARSAIALPLRTFEKQRDGVIAPALQEDLVTLGELIGVGVPALANVASLIGGVIYLAWLSIKLAIPVVALLTFGIWFYRRRTYQKLAAMFAEWGGLRGRYFGGLGGVVLGVVHLQQHAGRRRAYLEKAVVARARPIHDNIYASELISVRGRMFQLAWVLGILGVVVFALPELGWISRDLATGYATGLLFLWSPIDLALTCLAEAALLSPMLQGIHGTGMELHAAKEEIPSAPNEKIALNKGKPFSSSASSGSSAAAPLLELRDVRFAYEDGSFEIGPISFAMQKGEIVFLAGGNGSGKSTLARVLMGLYAKTAGETRVDGVLLEGEEGLAVQRSLFTCVLSECYVFEDLLGKASAANRNIEQARQRLEAFGLGRKVSVSDQGHLSTVNLSSGQRRRLALVAACNEDDRPILVLDEWAADQDPEWKKNFYEVLLPQLKKAGKCVFVISHDERWFNVADRLLVMREGGLVVSPVEAGVS